MADRIIRRPPFMGYDWLLNEGALQPTQRYSQGIESLVPELFAYPRATTEAITGVPYRNAEDMISRNELRPSMELIGKEVPMELTEDFIKALQGDGSSRGSDAAKARRRTRMGGIERNMDIRASQSGPSLDLFNPGPVGEDAYVPLVDYTPTNPKYPTVEIPPETTKEIATDTGFDVLDSVQAAVSENPLQARIDAAPFNKPRGTDILANLENAPTASEIITALTGGGEETPAPAAARPFKGEPVPPELFTPEGAAPAEPTEEKVPAAFVETPQTPEQTMNDYFALVDKMFPAYDTSNSKQDAADANAERDLDRTALLAQLTMAGGLIASAGRSWENAGKGVLGAAAAYDQGFQRYQTALQSSADRYGEMQKTMQGYDLAKRKAALDLYTSGRTEARESAKDIRNFKLEIIKQNREITKERREKAKDLYGPYLEMFKRVEGDTFNEEAMEEREAMRAAIGRAMQEFIDTGKYVQPHVFPARPQPTK